MYEPNNAGKNEAKSLLIRTHKQNPGPQANHSKVFARAAEIKNFSMSRIPLLLFFESRQ